MDIVNLYMYCRLAVFELLENIKYYLLYFERQYYLFFEKKEVTSFLQCVRLCLDRKFPRHSGIAGLACIY